MVARLRRRVNGRLWLTSARTSATLRVTVRRNVAPKGTQTEGMGIVGRRARFLSCLMALLVVLVCGGVAGAAPVTLVVVADAYVYELQPDQNFGSNVALRTDKSPLLRSFVRFDVQGLVGGETVTVRIFAATANGLGVDLHTVADTGWGESAITFNNAPPIGGVVGSSGPITAGTWLTFDVTSEVTSDGLVSFALTSPSNTATRLSSSEGSNPPELVLSGGGGGSSPYLVTRSETTYTAQSQANGTAFTGHVEGGGRGCGGGSADVWRWRGDLRRGYLRFR